MACGFPSHKPGNAASVSLSWHHYSKMFLCFCNFGNYITSCIWALACKKHADAIVGTHLITWHFSHTRLPFAYTGLVLLCFAVIVFYVIIGFRIICTSIYLDKGCVIHNHMSHLFPEHVLPWPRSTPTHTSRCLSAWLLGAISSSAI